MPTLAVVPSDPLSAYEAKGTYTWLKAYYNPAKHFEKVYLFSPHEKTACEQYGMTTVPTRKGELRDHIRQHNVDIVRAYGGYWPCDFACRQKVAGVPVVVSVHDTNPDELYPAIRRADFVFCMSEAVRELVLTRFPHPDRAWILPNRIDLDTMQPIPDADFSDLNARFPEKYHLLCVGRLSEQKNQDNMLRALRELGEDYGVIFVGRNDPAQLKELARELGVEDRVHFVESVPNNELPRWYNWADVLFNPSRWEGFGVVFIEALACASVIVTSDIRPMSEFITHGENGLLVRDYEDPAALAAMVRRAVEEDSLREKIRLAGPGSVTRFSREKVDALEVEYYERALQHAKENPPGLLEKVRCRWGW